MSTTDDFRAAVELLRGWGFHVTEWNGCYGRSNGGGWSAGRPVGHINHHYVCSLNPDQGYINNLVGNLANGSVVNWFADVHGVAYLIGTGPMNHAGTGNQSVLDRTRMDAPPPSNPASSAGSISGNSHYSGTEAQHPGDSTPWPGPMLDVVVAINAAEFLVWNYTENRAINHSEWSNRKIDMSAGGGINSDGWSAAELRRRVAARMSGSGSGDYLDMVSQDEWNALVGKVNAMSTELTNTHKTVDDINWGVNSDQGTRYMVATNTDLTNRALASADLANWGINDPSAGARVMIATVDAKVNTLIDEDIEAAAIQPPPAAPEAAAVVVEPPPA